MATATMERAGLGAHAPGAACDAYCEGCQVDVRAVRPAWYWKLAVPATWVVLAVTLVGFVLIGMGAIGVLALAPGIMFFGVSLLSTVHDEAFREPSCPTCRRMVHELDAVPPDVGRR